MRKPRSRLVSCALLATFLAAGSVLADGTDDARSHFTRGVELFKEADFRAALIEFQRAYEAAPNYKVLYNLGQTSLELQDYAGALKAFRGYLDGGGSQIPAARRTQVEADLKRLDSRVARLEIVVNVEGADVAIDDVTVGRSPLREPILVGAGRRKIAVTKAGLAPATRVIDVAGGDRPRVALELVEPTQVTPQTVIVQQQGSSETPTVTTQPVVRTVNGPSTAFYVSLVATSTLIVGTAVIGGIALASYNDFESKLGQVGVQASQVNDARNQTKSFALVTDIVGAVAIAGAITTVVLALTTSSKHTVKEKTSLYIGPGSLGVAGTF
jgi:hypothetical protein